MLVWPTITEQLHLSRRIHHNLQTDCPTAKTGLLGGGAFLSLDSTLFWLISLMLADNARQDYLEEGDDVGIPVKGTVQYALSAKNSLFSFGVLSLVHVDVNNDEENKLYIYASIAPFCCVIFYPCPQSQYL